MPIDTATKDSAQKPHQTAGEPTPQEREQWEALRDHPDARENRARLKEGAQTDGAKKDLITQSSEWLNRHRDFFTGTGGMLGVRNGVKVLLAVVPTAMAFTASRYAFKGLRGNSLETDPNLTFKQKLGHTSFAETLLYIFTGFTAFRAFCKMFQRSYDRIFSHEDAKGTAEELRNLPKNVLADAIDILPSEAAATAVSSVPLAAIPKATKEVFPSGPGDRFSKKFVTNLAGKAAAYPVFFALNNSLYDTITEGKDSAEYYKAIQQRKDPAKLDRKHRGIGELAFDVVTDMVASVPWALGNQAMHEVFGPNVVPGERKPMTNLAQEFLRYAPFVSYTVTDESAYVLRQKLLDRINQQHVQSGRA